MKNNFLKAFAVSAIFMVAFSVGIHLTTENNHGVIEASAYSTTSLPSTIDLNDKSDSDIRSYYSGLNSLSTSERQGTNLLKNLKPILKNGQKYLSYDSGNSIWDVYCIVDRDWTKSPASALPAAAGTYNSSTNKITNYKWGNNSSTYENPYLHALYYNRNLTPVAKAYGDHTNNSSTGINREHIWPKGAGFEKESSGGARGDIMHLWAANGHTNNIHSNNFYGYVDTSKSYTDIGGTSTYSMCAGNLSGKSKTFTSSSNTVFEPQDSDKGDIARACFYMVARYNYLSGSDSDGIDSNNPNLELVNNVSDFQSSGYESTTTNTGKLGILQDLLEWNRLDPPDEFEIHRNNLCHNNFTNNRNPFIDFPEWAEFIWGKSENGSYSSTSTGHASPNSDTINDFSSGGTPVEEKTLSSITLNTNSVQKSFNVGDSFNYTGLVVTANYSDSTSATVTPTSVSSPDMSSSGNKTVTVTYTEGGVTKTATYTITVTYSGGGGSEQVTVSTTIADYADNNNWVNSTKYLKVELDDIASASVGVGSTNTGRYYTTGEDWRFYQGESASLVISVSNGYELDSVTVTYNVGNTGVLLDENSNAVTSGQAKSVSGSSVTYTVGNTGSATNGQAKITAISVTYHSTSVSPTPTSINATVTKTYKVGETITKSDITVKDDLNNIITDFSFANNNYQFTYSDAASGGALTNKTFTNAITASDMACSLTVQVKREAYSAPEEQTITVDGDDFSSVKETTSATAKTQTFVADGITFTSTLSYRYNSYLSFKTYFVSTNNYATDSVFSNQTKFDTTIVDVAFNLGGNNKPTISHTLEFSNDPSDSNSWTTVNDGNFFYFRIRYVGTFSGYVNISSVVVTLNGAETTENVANYIMYEDTNGQCEDVGNTKGKFSIAANHFENMSKADRNTFMNSNDYVISTARTRLQAWAAHLNKTITIVNGDYVISSNKSTFSIIKDGDNNVAMIIVIALFSASLLFSTAILLKRKKEH